MKLRPLVLPRADSYRELGLHMLCFKGQRAGLQLSGLRSAWEQDCQPNRAVALFAGIQALLSCDGSPLTDCWHLVTLCCGQQGSACGC